MKHKGESYKKEDSDLLKNMEIYETQRRKLEKRI